MFISQEMEYNVKELKKVLIEMKRGWWKNSLWTL